MDLHKCCLFLPEFPLILVVFFPYIAAWNFTSSLSRLTPSSTEFSALCIGPWCFLGSYMGCKEPWNTFIYTSTASMNWCCLWLYDHAMQEIKGVTLAVAASLGSGSEVYQTVSVLKSQSQGCLYSVFLPPPWVDFAVQKAVKVMIYQTTAHRMSWAHFRFTEIFLWEKQLSGFCTRGSAKLRDCINSKGFMGMDTEIR